MSIPRKVIDWKAYDAFEGTDKDFAASIGLSPTNFAHYKKFRWRDELTSNGDLPNETHPEPNETDHRDEPTGNGNLPALRPSQPIAVDHIALSHPIASELDDLKGRIATLEAFMAAVQAQHRSASPSIATPSQSIAAHRRESIQWLSRGMQIAADMADTLDAYAQQHRLEKREVLDLALRTFFAPTERTVQDA